MIFTQLYNFNCHFIAHRYFLFSSCAGVSDLIIVKPAAFLGIAVVRPNRFSSLGLIVIGPCARLSAPTKKRDDRARGPRRHNFVIVVHQNLTPAVSVFGRCTRCVQSCSRIIRFPNMSLSDPNITRLPE